ncbi:hypothetical protein BZG02_07915 [Labilibaculum filiforme]|uniref:TonB-dependent receptor plug domain-containing protein n=1 Tax=Labilibaculum filiforme TaxID=1940526 RepID=A0A2N3I0S9_9BACT|nr:TonB-dependent receptor [Labilibaculum filiforme]PKQ63928.1 hypothetical protein BZG02_07915 [Labilibaculum filiforme]
MKKLALYKVFPLGEELRKLIRVMKITSFLILIASLQISANVYSQQTTFTVQFKNASIYDLMQEVKNKSEFDFLYSDDEIEGVKINNSEFYGSRVEDILTECLKETKITYVIEDKVIILMPAPAKATITAPVQKKELKGTVTDQDGIPLPGVSVVVKGTTVGAATDINGNYTLELVNDNAVLVYSFVGMLPKEIAYAGQKTIDVKLLSDATQMDEVVVVGYGVVMKKDLTGAISTVKSEELLKANAASLDNALSGKISGVFMTQNSGEPGAGSSLNIRGITSANGDNQPLYVIDGVVVTVTPQLDDYTGLDNLPDNPLMAINPADIESIDILKDASAAAIYGSRAANGVVIVTTKRGKLNSKPNVRLNYNYTVQNQARTIDYLNAEEFKAYNIDLANAYIAEGVPHPTATQILNAPDTYFGDADNDWYDLLIHDNAPTHNWTATIDGGSANVAYSIGVTGTDQEGLVKKSGMKRHGFRTNLDFTVNEFMKIGVTSNYNRNETDGSNALSGILPRPDMPIYNEDGSFYVYKDASGANRTSPVASNSATNNRVTDSYLASAYGEISFLKDFKFRSSVNVSVMNSKGYSFTPSYLQYNPNQTYATGVGSNSQSKSTTFENTLTYRKEIDKHRITGLFGIAWSRDELEYTNSNYEEYPDDEFLTNASSAARVASHGGLNTISGLNSQFGRMNYSYDDRYLATFTARRDGSSKFGPNNKWGFFPSGALAWKLHNESFLKDFEQLNELKLRASIGRTGSANLSDFLYTSYYTTDGALYAGNSGILPEGIPNADIKWEKTVQYDLGLNFSLFNHRLYGEVGYFQKNTSDIILNAPIPNESGFSGRTENLADVENTGFEFEIGADIIRTNNFRWKSNLNFSFINNEITKLNGGDFGYGNTTGLVKGESVGAILGYETDGFINTAEELAALNAGSANGYYMSSATIVGHYKYVDQNGDGTINSDDKVALGDMNADFYGGWTNTLSYKQFEFSFAFKFSKGNSRKVEYLSSALFHSFGTNIAKDIIGNTWTADNMDAKYPILSSKPSYISSSDVLDRQVQKADYIRLKNVRLAYTVPESFFQNSFVKGLGMYVAADNLWTITDYEGLDPEVLSGTSRGKTATASSDYGTYPLARSVVFGINVNF